jgi:NADH:ubiquinone oxidoreductase subunit F (NADH-binding)
MILDGPVTFDSSGHLTDSRQRRNGLPEHGEHFPTSARLHEQALLDAIKAVELTGRGGGHFPVARKLAPLVASGAGTVVINGSEGEVLSSKDAMLLQLHPHLVLDGAQALARLVRAAEVVVWLHEGAAASLASMQVACYERERDARHLTEVPVRIMFGPARYLTGEASAAIAGVRGMPVLPRFVEKPGAPWVDGDPVLLHNAETHARVGLLARRGADGYAPTSLVTMVLPRHRLVVEARRGTTFASLFSHERVTPPEFVLLGGYSGTWFPWERIAQLQVDPVELRRQGIAFGAGIIAQVPHGREGLEWTAEILEWMSGESAGQCGPCIFGLPELSKQFSEFHQSKKHSSRQRRKIEDLMQLVDGRGACRHPDGVVRMVRSAIEAFAPAGVTV